MRLSKVEQFYDENRKKCMKEFGRWKEIEETGIITPCYTRNCDEEQFAYCLYYYTKIAPRKREIQRQYRKRKQKKQEIEKLQRIHYARIIKFINRLKMFNRFLLECYIIQEDEKLGYIQWHSIKKPVEIAENISKELRKEFSLYDKKIEDFEDYNSCNNCTFVKYFFQTSVKFEKLNEIQDQIWL